MNNSKDFITPEKFEEIKKKLLSGPNGWLLFAACNSGINLAQSVKTEYEKMLKDNKSELKEIPLLKFKEKSIITNIFYDTETCPRLPEHVAGSNVFVFQNLHERKSGNTVNENIMQLFQVIRTLKVHGAEYITAVTPYSAYSRQDQPTFMEREATLAKLNADLLETAGVNSVLIYHPHSLSLHGFYEPNIRFNALNGLDLFLEIFKPMKGIKDLAIVSTDPGGAKFTIKFAKKMDVDYAISSKYRPVQQEAHCIGIAGNIDGKKKAIISDDETITGTSIVNAIKAVYCDYNVDEIYSAISHFKITEEHIEKLVEAHNKYGLVELHITDTIPQSEKILKYDWIKQHTLSNRFASTINRLHYNQSVSELFGRS